MICAIQHHPLEDLGHFTERLAVRGLAFQHILASSDALPQLQFGDRVILLGGHVNVDDAAHLPWLAREIEWLRRSLSDGYSVFGICLGAQLLSHALGARVSALPAPELGWQSIQILPEWQTVLGRERTVLQWHGQEFDLPIGAQRIASNRACPTQGYHWVRGTQNLLALQFHPEWSAPVLAQLLAESASDRQIALANFKADAHFSEQPALCEHFLRHWLRVE